MQNSIPLTLTRSDKIRGAMNRKLLLLLDDDDAPYTTSMPATTFLLVPPPPTTTTATTSSPFHHHLSQPSSTPFNSSMAIAVLILLAILLFMAFFSLYLRHLTEDRHVSNNLRHPHPPPPRSSSNHVIDPTIVLSLPLFSYPGNYNSATYQTECAVCLNEFEDRETVKVIPYCRHVFHPRCIDRWLYGHASCPVCRASTAQMLHEGKVGCGSRVEPGGTCAVERIERGGRVRITRCNSSSSDGSGQVGRV